jgi:hypothetical protein
MMSESTRKKIKNNFLNLTEKKKKEVIKRLKESMKQAHSQKTWKTRPGVSALEMKNKFGTCPEQARTLFWEEYNKFGRITTTDEMSGKLKNLVFTRFSTYREALLVWGISEQEYTEHIANGKINAVNVRADNDYFPKYDIEDVKLQYAEFFNLNKRLPTWGEVKTYGLPGRAVFQRVFGKNKSEVENSFVFRSID